MIYQHIKKNFFLILLLGLINPFLYYIVLFEAYNLLPAQEAQAINYTWVLVLSIFSIIFLKEELKFLNALLAIAKAGNS